MSSISVVNLGKAYKQYPNKWARLAEWCRPSSAKPLHALKWVLRNVSFSVEPGDALGIIGINGAGKSTLLKMIVGTTRPTTGSVVITGRVAALLELGMGFHPDFTGRQNAFMAGQLLGYSVEEVERLMPEIEAFAEIGEYIDQPVRVYSSGMQVRLAFSVATAIRPDVLIVDEALSVGDTHFQHKSFQRIKEFRELGTTLLIVSHDKTAIQAVCDRAILLSGGEIAMEGEPEAVMDYYNAMLADHQNQMVVQDVRADGKVQTISGTGEATISEVSLRSADGKAVEIVNVGQPVTLRAGVNTREALPELVLGYLIKDRLGQPVFGTNTYHLGRALTDIPAGADMTFEFDFPANLGPGTYSISVAVHTSHTHLERNYEWRDYALVFNVVNIDRPSFSGVAWIPPVARCSL
ncbi:ABC transporter ATP-binding protein [Uliginosibacterium sp. sgz301328]|uniref:ABC transporter ATP-binding protein n=1 Tax=Uliginosibacterium sp. sgz301328 TaxID=3243764 RepID=UPI00359EC9D4